MTCAEPGCPAVPAQRATIRNVVTGEVLLVEEVCDVHAEMLRLWAEKGAPR